MSISVVLTVEQAFNKKLTFQETEMKFFVKNDERNSCCGLLWNSPLRPTQTLPAFAALVSFIFLPPSLSQATAESSIH